MAGSIASPFPCVGLCVAQVLVRAVGGPVSPRGAPAGEYSLQVDPPLSCNERGRALRREEGNPVPLF